MSGDRTSTGALRGGWFTAVGVVEFPGGRLGAQMCPRCSLVEVLEFAAAMRRMAATNHLQLVRTVIMGATRRTAVVESLIVRYRWLSGQGTVRELTEAEVTEVVAIARQMLSLAVGADVRAANTTPPAPHWARFWPN